MNRKLVLNQPGGAPFGVLDNIAWWQDGMAQAFSALYASSTAPIILDGLVQTGGTITSGWVYYNGDVFPVVGGTLPFTPIGEELHVSIVTAITQQTYGDAVVRDFLSEKYGQMVSSTTTTSGVIFPLSSTVRFTALLGARAADTAIAGSVVLTNPGGTAAGNITGTVNYRLNRLTRTLHLEGILTLNSAGTISDPPIAYGLFTLPAAFRPTKTQYFEALIRYHSPGSGFILEDTNGLGIAGLYCDVLSSGVVNMIPRRPSVSSSYTVRFNHMMSID